MLIANRQLYSKDMDGKETSLILAGLSWTLREYTPLFVGDTKDHVFMLSIIRSCGCQPKAKYAFTV